MRSVINWSGGLLLLAAILLSASCGNSGKVPCVQQSECKDGKRCGLDGYCTSDKQTCQKSNECAVGEICLSGECKHITCNQQSDCVERGFFCNEFSFCEDGCADDSQCDTSRGFKCASESHICTRQGCLEHSDCKEFPYQFCHKANGAATGECVYTGKCSCEEDPNNLPKSGESNKDYCARIAKGDTLCQKYATRHGLSGEYSCQLDTSSATNAWSCQSVRGCRTHTECNEGEICVSLDGATVCRPGCDDNDPTRGCKGSEVCAQNPVSLYNWKVCQASCQASSECPAAAPVCVKARCISGCRDTSDCVDSGKVGYVCTTPTGSPATDKTCLGCLNNSDCEGSKVCNIGILGDKDITGESRGLCVDAIVCPTDKYGINDIITTAQGGSGFEQAVKSLEKRDKNSSASQVVVLPFEATKTSATNEAIFCQFEGGGSGQIRQELFKFDLEKDKIVTATLNAESSKGDALILSLLKKNGEKLNDTAIVASYPQIQRYGSIKPQILYAAVSGVVSRKYAPYSLTITQEDVPETCPGDVHDTTLTHEFKVDKTTGKPTEDPTNVLSFQGTICRHSKNEGNDQFKIKLPKDYNLIAKLQYNHDDPAINLTVTNAADSNPLGVKKVKGKDGKYELPSTEQERTVIVDLQLDVDRVGQTPYKITFSLEKYECADDYENNDTPDKAALLALPSETDQESYCTSTDPADMKSCVGVCMQTDSGKQQECREFKKVASLCGTDWFMIELLPFRQFDFQLCYGKSYTVGSDGQPNVFLLRSENGSYKEIRGTRNNLAAKRAAAKKGDYIQDSSGMDASRCTGVTIKTTDEKGKDNSPGIFYLKANLFSGSLLKYRYSYRTILSNGHNACPSLPHGTQNDAEVLDMTPSGKLSYFGSVCDKTVHWYVMDLTKDYPSSSDVDKQFALDLWIKKEHPIDMAVYKDGETQPIGITSGDAAGGLKRLVLNGTSELKQGRYYIKVFGNPSARGNFELQIYDTVRKVPQPWCNDSYELNNDEASATDLPANTSLPELTLCGRNATIIEKDVDYFKMDYHAGDTVTLKYTTEEVTAFVDKKASCKYGPSEQHVYPTCASIPPSSSGQTKTLIDQLTFARSGTIRFNLELDGKPPKDERNIYKYNIEYVKNHVDCPYAKEANNDVASATDLGSSSVFVYGKGICESGDRSVHWYKVTVPAGKNLYVSPRYNEIEYDIKTTILQSDGTTAVVSTDDLTGDKVLAAVADKSNNGLQYPTMITTYDSNVASPPATEYYIKVESKNGSRGKYALAVEISDKQSPDFAKASCPDIYKSENTNRLSASHLSIGEVKDLILCRRSANLDKGSPMENELNAEDYFIYEVPPQAALEVTVTAEDGDYAPAPGNPLGLVIQSSDGSQLHATANASDATQGGKKTWTAKVSNGTSASPAISSNKYLVKVMLDGNGDKFAKYSINASVKYIESCTPTKTGPISDSLAALKSVPAKNSYATSDVQLCELDTSQKMTGEEWVKLGSGITDLEVRINYSSLFGELQMQLIKYDGTKETVVDTAVPSMAQKNKIVYKKTGLDSLATYYLKITSPTNSRIKFKLWYHASDGKTGVVPTMPYCQDEYESNETYIHAREITRYENGKNLWYLPRATLCGKDTDWYKLELPAGNFTFIAYGLNDFSDFTFDIFDKANAKLSQGEGDKPVKTKLTSTKTLETFNLSANQTIYVKVAAKTPTAADNHIYGFLLVQYEVLTGSGVITDPYSNAYDDSSPFELTIKDGSGVGVYLSQFWESEVDKKGRQARYFNYTLPVNKKLKVSYITFPGRIGAVQDTNDNKHIDDLTDGIAQIDFPGSTTKETVCGFRVVNYGDHKNTLDSIPDYLYVVVLQEEDMP